MEDEFVRADVQCGRAYYAASVAEFLSTDENLVLAALVRRSAFNVEITQREAWIEQIRVMRSCLSELGEEGLIAFEFDVPRVGKRIDVLLVVGGGVFVLEFKVGAKDFEAGAIRQVWDYALDLKNFHSTSHQASVIPVLVVTGTKDTGRANDVRRDGDGVYRPLCVAADGLGAVVRAVLESIKNEVLDASSWIRGVYKPTPTIIEAALALYGGHGVESISRTEAGAINLSRTCVSIDGIIRRAREESHKAICFVTGVPGAGKTLVGLNTATKHQDRTSELFSVYLSGNGPLVRVLCEALARDRRARVDGSGKRVSLGEARSEVRAFVQNVHHFRDDCLKEMHRPPAEHVVLFDEAQRAWNAEQTVAFMRRKKGHPGFTMSEPEFLISCMDRHRDWAVIVCLVGGGQEINTGEAGIGEWIRSIRARYGSWRVYVSPRLREAEYAAGEALAMLEGHDHVRTDESLHLGVSMRSFRAENVSGWVKSVLDLDQALAERAMGSISGRFPIMLTRDLSAAKKWVRERARGNERYGMVVSSQAQRLKPHAIDVRVDVDPVHWFLHPRDDVRSSFYLEDAATEFDVQGLELDWTCVVWDADLRYSKSGWGYWSFRGSRWQRVLQEERRAYLKNAYRVLLTRARQGMVVVVPRGDSGDPTRSPEFYEGTYEFLKQVGCLVLD